MVRTPVRHFSSSFILQDSRLVIKWAFLLPAIEDIGRIPLLIVYAFVVCVVNLIMCTRGPSVVVWSRSTVPVGSSSVPSLLVVRPGQFEYSFRFCA